MTYGSDAVPDPDMTPFAAVKPALPLIAIGEWDCAADA